MGRWCCRHLRTSPPAHEQRRMPSQSLRVVAVSRRAVTTRATLVPQEDMCCCIRRATGDFRHRKALHPQASTLSLRYRTACRQLCSRCGSMNDQQCSGTASRLPLRHTPPLGLGRRRHRSQERSHSSASRTWHRGTRTASLAGRRQRCRARTYMLPRANRLRRLPRGLAAQRSLEPANTSAQFACGGSLSLIASSAWLEFSLNAQAHASVGRQLGHPHRALFAVPCADGAGVDQKAGSACQRG